MSQSVTGFSCALAKRDNFRLGIATSSYTESLNIDRLAGNQKVSKQTDPKATSLAICIVFIVICIAIAVPFFMGTIAESIAKNTSTVGQVELTTFELAGQLGDRLGAVNVLFSGVALLLIGWSLFQTNRSLSQMNEAVDLQSKSLTQTENSVTVQKRELEEHRKEFILNRVTNVIYRQAEIVNKQGRDIKFGKHEGLISVHYAFELARQRGQSETQKPSKNDIVTAYFKGKRVAEFIKKLDDTITLCTDLMETNEISHVEIHQLWQILRANLDDIDSTAILTTVTERMLEYDARRLEEKIGDTLGMSADVDIETDENFGDRFAFDRLRKSIDRARRVRDWT